MLPGLTGVIGPNGCGKSNLLEALRWVMGETSAKAMRGGDMDDVIFAGTSTRNPRSWAEVTLTLDNTDRSAPVGFNEVDQLEVTRRITRDVGSAYRINGKDVRARDVMLLFADAATGAHSPALVRQGQIAEIISAKPKVRRRILEDAAGIAGLYSRRHEAESRLKAAEENLARVADMLTQMEQRLQLLRRQSKQAMRYRELSALIRRAEALLLYRRWREAEAERMAADRALTDATRLAAELTRELSRASSALAAQEAALPKLREEDQIAAMVLARMQVERDGLARRAAEAAATVQRLTDESRRLEEDLERESVLAEDAGLMLERLNEEAEALNALRETEAAALANAKQREIDNAAVLAEAENRLDRLNEDAARLLAHRQSLHRRAEEAAAQRLRLSEDVRRATEQLAAAEAALAEMREAREEAGLAREAATEAQAEAEEALHATEAARANAQAQEAQARATLGSAEGTVNALRAEVQGLEKLLRQRNDDRPAIIAQLRVTPGYEAALAAALGEELRLPLTTLGGWGWAELPALPAPAIPDAVPLAEFVHAPAALTRRLTHCYVVDAAVAAAHHAALAPGQRLVSREGALWRWDGLARPPEDKAEGAALELQQRNRLAALQIDLVEAEAQLATARQAFDAARQAQQQAITAEASAREARRRADEQASATARQLAQLDSEITNRRLRSEALRDGLAGREADLAQAAEAHAEALAAIEALDDPENLRLAAAESREKVEAARAALMSARSAHDELRREVEQRERRLRAINREREDWLKRRQATGERLQALKQRIDDSRRALAEAREQPGKIAQRQESIATELLQAEDRRQRAAEALAKAEHHRREADAAERKAQEALTRAREDRASLEARLQAASERATEAALRLHSDLGLAPDKVLENLSVDPDTLAATETLVQELTRHKQDRERLGEVNLRAEIEERELEEERTKLDGERADLEAAIDKLRHGIANLNREGRERLLVAFERVNSTFATLFTHLFGGGEARLEMVESDDPLEAGLEIMCQPPGKKLSTLSLLSGGEQTLTAISLIFAVFLTNPSPICVLDEVDAPLDDANVSRFCDLLDEMTRRTQTRFLIITHHAVTMSRMARLFGVTMVEKGVSQLVSVDLSRAVAMVSGEQSG